MLDDNIPENAGVHNSYHSEQNNINYFSQVPVKDDERDLTELMVASSTIPPVLPNSSNNVKHKSDRTSGSSGVTPRSDAKKRAKQQRDLTRDLALLFPDDQCVQEEKAFSFAQAYYLKVRDRLDDSTFIEFVKALESFDNQSVKVIDLYHKVKSILKPCPELSEEFVAFLLPEQAMELGVYMEYLCITKMRKFLRKLEVYFNKQPQQIRKIYECLGRLADQSNEKKIEMSTVRDMILPLLKGSSFLTEYFLQLFPCEQPPLLECCEDNDFEKVDCGEFDEGSTVGQREDIDNGDYETVEIPDLEDPFGGDSCPCNCHRKSSTSASAHCFSCGVKFINGRIFIQNGKVLRPAKLVIEGPNKKEILERICKKPTVKLIDDKGIGSVRHRKRPAADSSPVKSGCNSNGLSGNSGNSTLLSPTGTESEDDISDFKLPTAKIKSPRALRNILKSGCGSKAFTNKDIEKDIIRENEILNANSFVLLDDLKNVDREKELVSVGVLGNNKSYNNSNNNKNNNNGNDESDKVGSNGIIEEVIVDFKSTDNDSGISELPSSSPLASIIDGHIVRDDEDDDIEYIEIDDDDAEDDVIDVEDDDDYDGGDDIEEDEEEIPHNDEDDDDDDDIEEVEMDEDEDKDLDIEYLIENNENDNANLNEKQKSKENCHDSMKSNFNDANITVRKNLPKISLQEIKMEIVDDEYNIKQDNIKNHCSLDCKNESSQQNFIQDVKMEVADEECNDALTEPDDTINTTESPAVFLSEEIATCSESELPSQETVTVNVNKSSSEAPQSSAFSQSWTKDEDKVILQTFQQEIDSDETFVMIRKQLPQRSVEEIKSRFHILMQLLKRMTNNKNTMSTE